MIVEATKIDEIHFFYECPLCFKQHFHGSCGELHNRIESRGAHCPLGGNFNVDIIINDKTVRDFYPYKIDFQRTKNSKM